MSSPARRLFARSEERSAPRTRLWAERAVTAGIALAMLGLPWAPLAAQDSEDADRAEQDLPLAGWSENRTVAIDLDEGSWISLDVSPDGQTIVFDFLGDLFTIPIAGGEATQITSGMAFDAQPRFSPDGEWITFQSDMDGSENLYVMRLDGTDTTQITSGGANRIESPEWTPDGDYIVVSEGKYRGGGLPKLKLYHKTGGGGAELIDEPANLKTLGAAFGDDDRWIWFARRTGDWQYNAQFPQYQLAVYDRETGETYGRSSRYGSGIRPTLSPDGHWLVYGTRHETETGLVLRDLHTGEERWLAYPVQHDDQESRASRDALPGMSFTPDSEFVVASWGGKIWRVPIAGGDAEEIPFRVRFDLEIGPEVEFDYPISDDPTFVVRQIRDGAPSPDGRRLAFTVLDDLWVADVDGSNAQALTRTADISEHAPTWSPDGQWIAYSAWAGDEGHVFRISADGGDPDRLTDEPGLWVNPVWSPAGDRIAVLRGPARGFRENTGPGAQNQTEDLVWIPAEGGAATHVMPMSGARRIHLTRDADRIYWYAGGTDGLSSVRWDGTDVKRHLRVRGGTPPGFPNPENASEMLMSPTGEYALADVGDELFVVTVPRVGGDTPVISVANPDRAQFPAWRITDEMGGEFPSWSADGRKVHYSLGNAHFVYDLDAAEAHRDSVEAAEAAAEEEEDEEESDEEEADDDEDEDDGYQSVEHRFQITAERDIPSGVAVLRGARIVTMRGDEVIERGDVVVRDNRIEAVGATGSVQVPSGAEVIDVSGKTIVPGFVDAHSHMWPSWGVHKKQPWIYLANLAYGVTATRDPQTATTDVLTYGDMVTAGQIIGPRIYSTGPGVFWQENIESLDHARTLLGKYSDYYDTNTIKMYVAGNRQQRQWIIEAARELRLMPTTEGSLNLKQNLTETIDGYPGLEHSLPVYPVYDDILQLFVESRRVYTPTLLVAYGGPWAENFYFQTEEVHDDAKLRRFTPHSDIDAMTLRRPQWFRAEQYVSDDHGRFVTELVEAGGRVGVGSHGQLQGLGYHWELWAVAAGGLSNHDALRTATIFGAEAIGLDQDVGSIEVGKLADLVILDGNPLMDLRNTNTVDRVMMNGRLFNGDTLDEEWPRQRALEPLWWWNAEPGTGLPGVGR